MKDLGKIQQRVLTVINLFPDAANDDAVLLANYWIMYDQWDESKSLYWNLTKATRPETITRRKRELYNLGLIEYSQERQKVVMEAYKNERDYKARAWGQ